MKEERYFYAPNAAHTDELPSDEAGHALRVLRLQVGDEIMLLNGKGEVYRARITATTRQNCHYKLIDQIEALPATPSPITIAVAPPKNTDRTNWFAEKATEIGVEAIVFLDTDFTLRKLVKVSHIDKIVVSAMKQSRKAYKPAVQEITPFKQFIAQPFCGQKFIAHCYDDLGARPFLLDAAHKGASLLLVGPEGDFSVQEVKAAIAQGFQPVSLGKSRLRTETAALVGLHLLNLANR